VEDTRAGGVGSRLVFIDLKSIYEKYILLTEVTMTDRARIFKSGGSQAVRLPKEFRFDDAEVRIYKVGSKVILEPVQRRWSEAFLALAGSAEDFPYPQDFDSSDPAPSFE